MKRSVYIAAVLLFFFVHPPLGGQIPDVADFAPAVEAVDSLLKLRTKSLGKLHLSRVTVKKGALNFNFGESLSDFPLRPEDGRWIEEQLKARLPEKYSAYAIGGIYAGSQKLDNLIVSPPGVSGKPALSRLKTGNRRVRQLVKRETSAPKGLDGRHIAIWQSHGHYYNVKDSCWTWQRPFLFQTVEDLYTQSYVVPLLVPMLENAGANVLLPRERDWHSTEIIIDNDSSETVSGRIHGIFNCSGKWIDAGAGFADTCALYGRDENPFTLGTALKAYCSPQGNAVAQWKAEVPERGEYCVYVSYASLPESSDAAQYTVHTLGGDVGVTVNQTMGGGVWVYLGTFEFGKGESILVSLSNRGRKRTAVTADAVKIGGGMGNVARCNGSASGRPRFAEGARYFLQWAGFPAEVWSQNDGQDDYRDDLMSRGAWVKHLSAGTWVNPKKHGGLKIPVDLSFSFHTDSGIRPDDRIVGTLAIYTLKCEHSTLLPNGCSRATCRELTDFVQTQVVNDIRAQWDSLWQRRQLWNRSYSESRTTGAPAVLLELLSHQNFEDMKYGSDPVFRFTVARSCYKAILKYLSMRYSRPYVVQPLPVEAFCARLPEKESWNGEDGLTEVTLSWREQVDTLETTAAPTSFRLYSRINDGGWDNGKSIKPVKGGDGRYSTTVFIRSGQIHSYKVVAVNEGGLSFPSETLSVGIPDNVTGGKVTVVNNFNRTSGPSWFDSPVYAGFDNRTDSGVPYLRDWHFTGEQYEFHRDALFHGNTGFGASRSDWADKIVGGNTFDYPYVHGKSVMKAGYAFESCSAAAFISDSTLAGDAQVTDVICGKECRVRTATRTPARGGAMPAALRAALRRAAARGCGLLVSGSHIATDVFSSVYPLVNDAAENLDRTMAQDFVRSTLGYGLLSSKASFTGEVVPVGTASPVARFPVAPCPESYCAESPDAIVSLAMGSEIFLRYLDTGLPAAIRTRFPGYGAAVFGFPLEITGDEEARDFIFANTLEFLTSNNDIYGN